LAARVASTHAGIEPFLHAADKARFIFALFLNSPMIADVIGAKWRVVPPLTQQWLRH